jgi:hypothetical protein
MQEVKRMSDHRSSAGAKRECSIAPAIRCALPVFVAAGSFFLPVAESAQHSAFGACVTAQRLTLCASAASVGALAADVQRRPGGAGGFEQDAYVPRYGRTRAPVRIRVRAADGVFLVFDAAVPPDRPRKRTGALAYWNDFAGGMSYVYGRLMATETDVGHALWNLEADLGIDTIPLTETAAALDGAWARAGQEDVDPTTWLPMTRETMLALMGFDAADAGGFVAVEGEDPEPDCCPIDDPCCPAVAALLPEYPDPPAPDAHVDEVIVATVQALECCPTGGLPGGGDPPCEPCCGCLYGCCGTGCCPPDGGNCPDDCTDSNRCTADECVSGACQHPPDLTAECCESPDPCCNPSDPCCDDPNRCCNADNPCCQSDDPCCNPSDPCCGSSDPCCNPDNPCCGTSSGPCCQSTDPCCNDPCCYNTDPCDPVCGDPCVCMTCPDDGDPCTEDDCLGGVCVYPPGNEGAACDDENPCTVDDVCSGGSCTGVAKDCDDGDPCQVDACNAVTGECYHYPDPCEDGLACTVDCCLAVEGCQHFTLAQTCSIPDAVDRTACAGSTVGISGTVCNTGDCAADFQWELLHTEGLLALTWISPTTGEILALPAGQCASVGAGATIPDAAGHGATAEILLSAGSHDEPVPPDCDSTAGAPASGSESCAETFNVTVLAPDLDFSALADTDETDPGGVVKVNDDDDNGNGTSDMEDDAGPTAGENDLVGLMLDVGGATVGTVQLQCGSAKVNVYRNADRSHPVILPAQWAASEMPPLLYIEGVEPSDAPRDVALVLRYEYGDAACEDTVNLTVVQVESITWERADPGNANLDACPNNGGLRIFPGKTGPLDGQPALRQTVKLVATLVPAGLDVPVTVHFRVWDVDDPFDQLHGPNGPPGDLMADVHLIDSNMAGPDNRGQNDPGPGVYTADTNAEEPEKAVVTVTVAMQPGDNYRAAASCLPDAVSTAQTTQSDADLLGVTTDPNGWFIPNGAFAAYRVPTTWSPMLTVWRKLHVETDSMARPTFAENTVSGQWNTPRFIDGQLWIDIPDQGNYDDFENGYIRIQAAGFPDLISIIIDHESSWLDDPIRTNISVATWGTRPDSGDFIASDDDLRDQALFTAGVVGAVIGVGNPPNGFLPLPDTSRLAVHYQPAFILPVVEPGHTSVTGISFVKNLENIEEESAWIRILPSRTLAVSTPAYWTAYVYSAFQAESAQDYDGELKATKAINTHAETVFGVREYGQWNAQVYTGMSAIFAEALDDGFGHAELCIAVAHEIAHTLGVDHTAQLMDELNQTDWFAVQSLVELRSYAGP